MVTQTCESGPKELKVVFEKKQQWNDGETQTAEIECQCITEADITDITKNLEPEKLEETTTVAEIFAEIDENIEHKEEKIKSIGRALQTAYHRENIITDKFLNDVESMVTRFNTELEKIQDIFGSIIKHLPQVRVETVQKNFDKVVPNADPTNVES